MSTAIQPLTKLNLDSITAQAPKTMGKAKLVFLSPMIRVSTCKVTQAWPIRPADEKNDKFTLEVRLESGNPEAEAFKSALNNYDMKVRQLAFENRKAWFGSGADTIETEKDLRTLQTMSVRRGAEKPDGSGARYDDTVRFKITGWQNYVDEILYNEESKGDNKFPSGVKWRTRLADPQGHGGPDDLATKFYICENRDMTTGKEQMAPWTPCQDPAGNQVKDASGNTVWEFVGPKHAQPGCKLTLVFQPTMVWLAGGKFGVTLNAKQVFITPPPPKPKNVVEGIEIVDLVDPILASRAAKQAMTFDDLKALDDLPLENDEEAPEAEKTVEAPTVTESPVGKKRPSTESPAKATKGTKKSKTVTVDEDF